MNAKEIFLNAIDIEDAKQRQAFVNEQCQGDESLRQRVLELLAADQDPDSLFENPMVEFGSSEDDPGQPDHSSSRATTTKNHRINNFELSDVIGEGGMGTVYHARQLKPIRRDVALKIVKPGLGSQELIDRFESERQTLAMMEHPNIAHVFDAGVTSEGLPYFVMELVRGQPINDYCDRRRLSTRDRMQLFSTVCRAIQHAHQKGIIHRDIKPSNILVFENDGQAVVKVIDFGLAKAFQSDGDQQSDRTEVGRIMGTLAYMSPEQAGLNPTDLDTRSDVYSLGVLLYELLTGTTPIERARLQKKSREESLKLIREEDAPRPSNRLSCSPREQQSSVCDARQTTAIKLERQLCGDLDWIALKALEKDRDRRYSGPAVLADDVDRFLRHEQIEARPPTTAYQLKKFAQRHPTALGIFALVSAALVIGLFVSMAVLRARSQMLATQQFQNAQLLQRQGDWAPSLVSLDAAERFGWQDEKSVQVARLQAHFALNDLVSAGEVVEQLRSANEPDGSVLLWEAELALARMDDPVACLDLVQKAVDADLNEADRQYAAGLMATNCEDALSGFRAALEKDSFHHRAHRMHAYLLVILGRTEEARERLALARTNFPDDQNLRVIELLADIVEGRTGALEELQIVAANFPETQEQELAKAIGKLLSRFRPAGLKQTEIDPFHYFESVINQIAVDVQELTSIVRQVRSSAVASRLAALPPVVSRNLGNLVEVFRLRYVTPDPQTIQALHAEARELLGQVAQDFPEGTVHHARGLDLFDEGIQVIPGKPGFLVTADAPEAEEALIRASQTPALAQIHLNSLRVAFQIECVFLAGNTTFAPDFPKEKLQGTRERLRDNVRRLMLVEDMRPNDATQVPIWLISIGETDLAQFALGEILRRHPNYPDAIQQKIRLEEEQGNYLLALRFLDKYMQLQPDSEKSPERLEEEQERRERLLGKIEAAAQTLRDLQEKQAGEANANGEIAKEPVADAELSSDDKGK